MENKMQTFEYGAMSSRYSCEAANKLTAYCAMCAQYNSQAFMIALYEPKELVYDDSWMSFDGKIWARLDEIFLKESNLTFDEYFNKHIEEIKACYHSIKQLC